MTMYSEYSRERRKMKRSWGGEKGGVVGGVCMQYTCTVVW